MLVSRVPDAAAGAWESAYRPLRKEYDTRESNVKRWKMQRREVFRRVIESDKTTVAPLIHDALSAKVADTLEFEAIGISGHGVSVSSLGLPDAGYTTMSEMVTAIRNITHAVDAPVFVDVDTGFGNFLNARRTAREVIRNTEAAGLYIEDQVDPKRCGQLSGKRVIDRDEAVRKVAAVCDVRDEIDEDFVVIARTDSLDAEGGSVEEATVRGNEFRGVGADMIFVDGLTSEEVTRRIGENVDASLLYNYSGLLRSVSPRLSIAELSDYGYTLACFHGSMTPSILASHEFMRGFRENGVEQIRAFEREHDELPVGDFYEFEGMDEVSELEQRYSSIESASGEE